MGILSEESQSDPRSGSGSFGRGFWHSPRAVVTGLNFRTLQSPAFGVSHFWGLVSPPPGNFPPLLELPCPLGRWSLPLCPTPSLALSASVSPRGQEGDELGGFPALVLEPGKGRCGQEAL